MKKLSKFDQVYSKIVSEQTEDRKVGIPLGSNPTVSNGDDVNVVIEEGKFYTAIVLDLYEGLLILQHCEPDDRNQCLRAENGRKIFYDGNDKEERGAIRHKDIKAIMEDDEFTLFIKDALANR